MVSWHTADEFLSLSEHEARAWAGALGWELRDMTHPGRWNDDLRYNRIDVAFDEHDRVRWADIR